MRNCFFFSSRRRHTRWTGDWSSDVCSSDLARLTNDGRDKSGNISPGIPSPIITDGVRLYFVEPTGGAGISGLVQRSEERRVGKECRSGWSPYPLQKKARNN